jgi:glycosyltransferase involved in cell wall biosynthesis
MARLSLLLVIPAHNEAQRLEPTLRRFAAFARDRYAGPCELLVVVNGSTDDTLSLARQVAAEYPAIRALDIPERIGKGGALIEGLQRATACDLVGYVDADGATGPESFFKLVDLCATVDCVVGSRRVAGAVIHQSQPSHRQFASKVFHLIVGLFFHLSIKDTQCGAKVMKRTAVQKVLPSLQIADMAFDVNLLFALKRAGCTMREAPVDWTDHLGSKVSYFRTSLVMFLSILRLRLVYSPLYRWLRPLRPLEAWIYRVLRNPPPRPRYENGTAGRGRSAKAPRA